MEIELAQHYAQYVAPTLVTLVRRAVDLAELEPGYNVLDVCTATGLTAFLAAERVGREGSVVGMDESAAMLAVAQERSSSVGYDYIRWQQGDAAQLTFADESFDVVFCVQGLMDLPRPDAALEEIRRVLVERGRLVVTLWGTKAGNEWMSLLENALRYAGPDTSSPRAPGLTQPGNLEILLQSLGYEDIEVARVPDRMRFRDPEGFWHWARVASRWGATLNALPLGAQERVRTALQRTLATRVRDGEVTLQREIVYARAVAPEAA